MAAHAVEDVPSGSRWTCWETTEHLANAMFSYAARFTLSAPPLNRVLAFDYVERRPDGPTNLIYANRSLGVPGLLEVLESCGGFLTAMAERAPADVTAFHIYGASNPEGFAAMAVVETFVHTYDIATGLGLEFTAPDDPCDRALRRLFPDVPRDTAPWPTLLWATGRGELPGRERLTSWRWRG